MWKRNGSRMHAGINEAIAAFLKTISSSGHPSDLFEAGF